MTAALVSSRLHSIGGNTGLTGASVTARFYVRVDEPTTPQQVILLAQGADDSDDDNRPVPFVGAPFKTHLDGQTTPDNSIIVSNISAEQREPGVDKRLAWVVVVQYQNRNASAIAGRELNLRPTERKARFRTEIYIQQELRDRGENQQALKYAFLVDSNDPLRDNVRGKPETRDKGTDGPITNASGRLVSQVPVFDRRLPVFVMMTYTLNPFEWISINDNYTDEEGKPYVNDKEWRIFNQRKKAGPRRCMFFGAEISDPLYWGREGAEAIYYELRVKVLYDKRGHDIRVRNEGVDYWRELTQTELNERPEEAKAKGVLFTRDVSFASGLPVPPPIVLNDIGGLADDQTKQADILTFRDLKGKSFNQLTTDIRNA